ncbi:CoxG family protein [Bacillus badius]|uniref:Carbon monoxide oxidation accessory protein CoxG n=1 Tax=Bacillus badius TaxID=1455 RepID=A0ABR5AUC5_BACBA|nr:carbon monoxide dehydrogenase subunit G [Bacillus badius]KIL76704.1 Carbon monoxide oxidation accessory protein CoxG [Bacillus badius]KIL78364.1 Carbon monoxide oxidation accessory protein CoxG [Bacillus badius]KZR57708.1 carbon monoxide dehydrogenase [Bacillus badius]MED4715887.1 carbon monoxide dehydrogenase subunit G [Bacillus badius]
MNIEYSYSFKGVSRELLWKTLQNKEVLQRALPGCQSFEEAGENVFNAELGLNIGPIKGRFTGVVRQVDMQEPEAYRLLLEGKGKPGEIDADAKMSLEESDEGTLLTCCAEVKVTGILASMGQRVMGGVAKVILGQFFKDIQKETKEIAKL